jgi:hypothetical protein
MVLENKCVDLSLFFLFWAIVFPSLDGSEIVILGLPFENEEQIWACSVRST